jgi:hypothetical protein
MLITFEKLFNTPSLLRAVTRTIIRDRELGSYEFRYGIGALDRPNYAYLVFQAARLARRLGEQRVSVIEFGVAGGAGLVAMEYHAEQIERIVGVKIDVYGFDTGEGLPPVADYRDLPYHWKSGSFKMDVPLLQSKLKRAKLVIGNADETVPTFTAQYNPAPIGAISFDLDFYSSTMAAFKILEIPSKYLLPRMPIYFDDVVGGETEFYNDFTGVRLAIHDFNAAHDRRKLSPLYCLTDTGNTMRWHHHMWSFHAFDHFQYLQFVSDEDQQIPLRDRK